MRPIFNIRLIALAACIVISVQTFGQKGNPFLTHYNLPQGISSQNWDFRQGDNGLMYVLNRKGIFSFDGLTWDNLGVTGRPIAIAYDKTLFYTTDRGVGYLKDSTNGERTPTSILETKSSNFFYKLSSTASGLYAVSPTTICKINVGEGYSVDTIIHEDRPTVFISDLFVLNSKLYHVSNRALICQHKPEGGYEILAGLPIGLDMLFTFIHSGKAYIGVSNNKLYIFDGSKLVPFEIKDQQYLNASLLSGGVSLNNNQFALSTVNGGCIIVNSTDGSSAVTFNYVSGLPDDEVFSVGTDAGGGLWISHGMGITRADLAVPISTFGHYHGLKGNILSSIEFKEKLYVGTSDGLFVLDEKRDYKAINVTIKSKKTSKTETGSAAANSNLTKSTEDQSTVEAKKKGFLSRLFSRRSTKEDEPTRNQPAETQTSATHSRDLEPLKRTIYQIQSVTHVYSKIEGVNGKVKQLIEFNGKLLAATNLGLYEVNSSAVKTLVSNKNITFASISKLKSKTILLGTDAGAYTLTEQGGAFTLSPIIEDDNQLIVSAIQLSDDRVLLTNEFDILLAIREGKKKFEVTPIPIPGSESSNPIVRWIGDKAMAFNSSGAYTFNPQTLELEPNPSFSFSSQSTILFNQSNFTWIKTGSQWSYYPNELQGKEATMSLVNLLDNPSYIHFTNDSTLIVVDGYSNIFKINKSTSKPEIRLNAFLASIMDKQGVPLNAENIVLSYTNNALRVKMSAPSFIKEGSVQFQYKVMGLMADWSQWSPSPFPEFPFLPKGEYIISLRAKDILGNMSETVEFTVNITPPFWQTTWFYALCLIAVIAIFTVTVKVRERNLRREKEILEQKVKERTKTIEEQKEILQKQRDDLEVYNAEILQQKEEIEAQRDEIQSQRDHIFKQNEEITQSISYARRIQSAVMPAREVVESILSNQFILFRPRDIVSGDFYWMTEKENHIVVAAADCTGHGIPGAFMSMMGVSFLNDIVNVEGLTEPDQILNNLRTKIISSFNQTRRETETRDGMDIAVCVYHKDLKRVVFAGAYNPLYLIRNGELTEYKADKMPVGAYPKQDISFTTHAIELQKGDSLYIFSDGFIDQFGGPEGRKFMSRPFKQLLTSINGKPMPEQKKLLEDTLDRWQGAYDQVDDVLVIGITV